MRICAPFVLKENKQIRNGSGGPNKVYKPGRWAHVNRPLFGTG